MKANELMVGGWAIRGNITEEPLRITDICASKNNVYLDLSGIPILEKIDKINPIPLTPEILGKNFESDDNNFGYQNYRLNANFIIENRGDRFCLVRIVERYYYATFFVCNINYVHQLQHAIYLLGIDKEIVL